MPHASQLRYAGSGHCCWVYLRQAVFFKWVPGSPLPMEPFGMATRVGVPSYRRVCRSLDASAALGVARRLAGRSPAVNNLAAELGLRLQCTGCALQDEHFRGTLNVEADALGRLTQVSSVPVCLQHVPRVYAPVRNDSCFWTWPTPKKFGHLRVTSHVTVPCCLHSTASHHLSSDKCCFAVLSEPRWGAKALYP